MDPGFFTGSHLALPWELLALAFFCKLFSLPVTLGIELSVVWELKTKNCLHESAIEQPVLSTEG